MTKVLRMLAGAGLCCALTLALGSAGRPFLPGRPLHLQFEFNPVS